METEKQIVLSTQFKTPHKEALEKLRLSLARYECKRFSPSHLSSFSEKIKFKDMIGIQEQYS